MKNLFMLRTLALLSVSCTNNKKKFTSIEFKHNYLFNSEIEHKVNTDTVAWKHQLSAADYASKGDYKNALIHWDTAFRTRVVNYTKEEQDSINQKYEVVSALDYIVEQAKKHTVVILNEAHHNSSHRVFTRTLLQNLYSEGYTNLGLEALGNGEYLDSLLNDRKYPVQSSGIYTSEPQFGNLIRTALSIGFHVFAYENMSLGQGKPREMEQAKNIQKWMDSKPNEKFLIHCGFAHAYEGIYSPWEKAMAGRLTEYTGINPFTINQTLYTEKSNSNFNHPLLKTLTLTEPSVLLDKNKQAIRYERKESWTDVAVLHPNTRYTNNRPHWLFNNDTKSVSLDLIDFNISFPVLILAFKKGEDINEAVPVDIYEVSNNKLIPHLALAKGDYDSVLVNKNNSALKFEIHVD